MNLSPRHEGDWLVVIPLAEGVTLSTGGKLYKGFAAVVDDRWDFSSDVPMIFLRPKILVQSPIPPRREWISTRLSEKERNLREEIKALLPRAGTSWDRNTHEINYSSDELTKKLCELGDGIVQETVLTPLLSTFWNYWANQMTDCKQKLTWTVGKFPVPKRVINERSWMIVIPLHENTILTPRGRLEDDAYTWIPDEPIMPPDTPVIFCR
ncbi:uncharacterized protein ASPGLDRAFT_791541 [Aspergillus glaucus CBS 516.65]|uniref:Uncharacterized protein n=1 Tax=Aspergillus glaucus CBS 516.65 TaxID=1160497 RepID=A0A1L9VAB0_ASPGL|nr:hypothetical protein ASPGLDRAFT_791541 [Aspergillus glaucus CBS 516.65]OJJ80840.1 hypothetical protein ASPGLDRAFT_791541 [Aspergillus glaucus CBS 516.65]